MSIIIGIKLPDKINNAVDFQAILTKFNCIIKMRIGINNTSVFCSSSGIVLLQIEDTHQAIELEKELLDISGIELQRMIF